MGHLCPLGIVFHNQVVGHDDGERGVFEFGLSNGSLIEVVRQVRNKELAVFVLYVDLEPTADRQIRPYGIQTVKFNALKCRSS